MAYLDNERVVDLVADIKALADATYLPKIPIMLDSGTNANSVVYPGLYSVYSVVGSGFPQEGNGRMGILIVLKMEETGRHIKQIFWRVVGSDTDGNKRLWIRTRYTETDWTSWMLIDTCASVLTTPSIKTSLPTGVTDVAKLDVVQAGNTVTVSLNLTRDTNALTRYASIAEGLPLPVLRPMVGSATIPFGIIPLNSNTTPTGRGLFCSIDEEDGELWVARGETAGNYSGTFTYMTNDFSKL